MGDDWDEWGWNNEKISATEVSRKRLWDPGPISTHSSGTTTDADFREAAVAAQVAKLEKLVNELEDKQQILRRAQEDKLKAEEAELAEGIAYVMRSLGVTQ